MIRGTGLPWDLRRSQPYEIYSELQFEIPVGKNSDCYDRYLLRVEEMKQSLKIMSQCINMLRKEGGPVSTENNKLFPPKRAEMKKSMEALIPVSYTHLTLPTILLV